MRFGICAPFQEVANLTAFPFDYLEENIQRFLAPEKPREYFEERWQAACTLPVPIEAANSLLPSDLFLVATPTRKVDTERLERYIKTALQRADQAGIRILVFGSGGARACPAGYDVAAAVEQIGDHLARWSTWAHDYGVQIVLEPLRYEETNTINTVAEGGALVSQRIVSGARLLADVYHMLCNAEAPETLLPWTSLFSHVHVAEKQGRTAPGRHGEDFRPYFSVLQHGGYDQRISIECNWHDLPAEVELALRVLREQWEQCAHASIG